MGLPKLFQSATRCGDPSQHALSALKPRGRRLFTSPSQACAEFRPASPWHDAEFGIRCGPMNDPQGQIEALFGTLRNSADPDVFAAIEKLVRDGEDRHLV